MKKERKIFSVWLPPILWLFIGCSGQEPSLPEEGPDMEIRLVTDLTHSTRSAIGQFKGDTIAFARGTSSGAYSEVWKAKAAGGEARLLKPQYYPADNSPVYLCGYYPAVVPDGRGVPFRLTGREDVLVSNEQSGCLTDMFWQDNKRFTFRHLLAQSNVRLKVADGYPAGACLKRLCIHGSHPAALLDLYKGQLSFYGDAVPLSVYEADEAGLLLTTVYPDTLIGPVMVEPGVSLALEVTVGLPDGTSLFYSALPIRFGEANGWSVAGTSYTLSVLLNQKTSEISLTVFVADWKEENGGNIIL